jgi:hypothetical protein
MKYALLIPDRSRIAPFTVEGRTLRAWMRGADLRAPKWKVAAVYFSDKFYDKPVARYSVSKASAVRAKARAAVVKPQQIVEPPTFKKTDIEPVDYGTTISMLMDGLFDETGIATRRRVYDGEESAMLSRWERGLFSQTKYDAGPFPIRGTRKGGIIMEDRPNPVHQRRQISRHHDRAPTDQDLASAFGLTLWWARKINAVIKNRCNAKTLTARAYQAAAAIQDYHRHRMGIGEVDIIAADLVIEAVSAQLRRPGRIDWTQRTATLDMLEGASSYEVGDRFGRDPSSIRERADSELAILEAKLGSFCRHIWQPPQRRESSCYNTGEDSTSGPEPWLASRWFSPADRAAFVLHYLDLASGKTLAKWGNFKNPLSWIYESRWIRQAYKLIAAYLENGGSITTGYRPGNIPEKWYVDRRTASRVREDIGLDPLDGLIIPPRYGNEFDQVKTNLQIGSDRRCHRSAKRFCVLRKPPR